MSRISLHELISASPHRKGSVVRILVLCVAAGFFTFPYVQAAPKKEKDPFPQPSIGHVLDPVTKKKLDVPRLRVERGASIDIILKGVAMPGDFVEFEVDGTPAHGSLSKLKRAGRDTGVFSYTPDPSRKSATDRAVFKFQTGPENAWGRIPVEIQILDPPARLEVEPEQLDFSRVPIGETRVKTLRLRNGGGSLLRGTLEIGIPWSIIGPPEFALAEGEARTFEVAFSPWSSEEQRSRISIELPTGHPEFIGLSGEGIYRFAIEEPIVFEPVPGGSPLEIPVKNLTGGRLDLFIHAPPPLISASALILPPDGEAVLKLDVLKKHFTGKSVELTLRDRDAVRGVRVVLPPPPALLEWGHPNATLDLGGIPFRHTERPEVELSNRGSTAAVVRLADGGEGWTLDKDQKPSIEIPPGETVKIPTIWKLPEQPGPASARLIASHGGVDHTLLANATVLPEETPASAASGPSPSPTPTQLNFLTPEERESLLRRMPSDIRPEAIPDWWRVDSSSATISWTRKDSSPVQYHVEILRRSGRESLIDSLEKRGERFQVPEELPQTKPEFVWKEYPAEFGADGRWKSMIPDLTPGYHSVRLIAVDPAKKIKETQDYRIFIPAAPWPPTGIRWTLIGLAALLLVSLLRRPLGRLRRLMLKA